MFHLGILFTILWKVIFISANNNIRGIENDSSKNDRLEASESWTSSPITINDLKLGQVSGIAVDSLDNVYIFHRADRVWNANSFDNYNDYQEKDLGPIKESTILMLNKNGTLIHQWGSEMFYMPHGISVDSNFNVWVTDVALHQIMKLYPQLNSTMLVLGIRFVPGKDSTHFCKPTSVAVVSNGDFFVADGYCNSRIMKFNSEGVKILEWGRSTISPEYRPPGPGEFYIPHALTLAEDKELVCVADRENGRIQCFNIKSGNFSFAIKSGKIGHRIFSVAYSNQEGGVFYLVNGQNFGQTLPVQGFKISLNGDILGTFGSELTTPHDLAISNEGRTIYVAEINPFKAWKFISNRNSTQKPSQNIETPSQPGFQNQIYHFNEESSEKGLTGALMVTSACLIFSAAIVISAFKYSRSRESGTMDSVSLIRNSEI